jgi:hypothetical protein
MDQGLLTEAPFLASGSDVSHSVWWADVILKDQQWETHHKSMRQVDKPYSLDEDR